MAAAAAAAEVQNLLRFLTQDAKVPLATALPKIGALRKQNLNSPAAIAIANTDTLDGIFGDSKLSKQVSNAAKRASNSKKRTASETSLTVNKRHKNDKLSEQDAEANLALPITDYTDEELMRLEIETNRAPLFLAFAVTILGYTMPAQPLSSRLSLAQAVVSANSQSKAKSIGLAPSATAEDEGWAQGQPKVCILRREIAVMRRQYTIPAGEANSQETIKHEEASTHEAFWGLDLEALRKSNGPLAAGKLAGSHGPPIHSPQSARAYLLKSMSIVEMDEEKSKDTSSKKKQKPAEVIAAKEKAAAVTLEAIDLLCRSWSSILSQDELDKRAWSWYLAVRPEVAQGQAGWGQRGRIRLADILKLRRNV